MGLYINGVEYDIWSPDGSLLTMEINPYHVITNGIKFISADGYVLKDKYGVYLTMKGEVE